MLWCLRKRDTLRSKGGIWMKKKLVLLAGVVAAAWGVKKLMRRDEEPFIDYEPAAQQPERPDERLAA